MKADTLVTAEYRHPRERVWAALTDPAALAEWLMPNDFAPVVGREFTFRTKPAPGFDGVVHCRVLEMDPPERMVWSWNGGPIETTLTFTLEELPDGGTRFQARQVGFHGLRAQLTRLILQSGSRRIYGELLPAYLDKLAGLAPRAVEVDCVGGWRSYLAIVRPWKAKPAGQRPPARPRAQRQQRQERQQRQQGG
jgi:uncharacterized protein YndB with AHSA1/START domain